MIFFKKIWREILIVILLILLFLTVISKYSIRIVLNEENKNQIVQTYKQESNVKNEINTEKPKLKPEFPFKVDSIFLEKLQKASNGDKMLITIALINTNGQYKDNNVMDIVCYDENCNVENHCAIRQGMGKTFFKKYKTIKECFDDFRKEMKEAKIIITEENKDNILNQMNTELLISKKVINNYKQVYGVLEYK